jgi:hypothetical protein
VCPTRDYIVDLGEEPIPEHVENVWVTWKHWYTVDPEIPHIKTYYAKWTKTTEYEVGRKEDFACVDPRTLSKLKDALNHLAA